MASRKKGHTLWLLFMAVGFFLLAVANFVGARHAAAHHTVVSLPDRIGGVGDTWMYPGQAYILSVLCFAFALYSLIALVRSRR
jgi:hypothetical protein